MSEDKATRKASLPLRLDDGGLGPNGRCAGPACDEIVLTNTSGFEIDPDAPPRWSGPHVPVPGGPQQIEILHADSPGDYLALIFDVTASRPVVAHVTASGVREVVVAGGPGAHIVVDEHGTRAALTTGLDGPAGVPRDEVTHWLARDPGGQWNVTRQEHDAIVSCIAGDGRHAVVIRGREAFLEGGAVPIKLPLVPGAPRPNDAACTLAGTTVLSATALDRGGFMLLDGDQMPVRPWAFAWSGPGIDQPLAWRSEAREWALSPTARHAAYIDQANNVFVLTRDGTRRQVATRMVDIAFLSSGDLVALARTGAPTVIPETELP